MKRYHRTFESKIANVVTLKSKLILNVLTKEKLLLLRVCISNLTWENSNIKNSCLIMFQ